MTVFVARQAKGGHRPSFHTDPECRVLNQAAKAREVARDHPLVESREECQHCSGEFSPESGSRGTYLATVLDGMDPDDLGGGASV